MLLNEPKTKGKKHLGDQKMKNPNGTSRA